MRVFLALLCLCAWASSVEAQDTLLAGDQQRFEQGTGAYDAGDYAQAYAIFLDLAGQDDLAAMRNVALMKRKGQGTETDSRGARQYLEEAAEGGLPTAQYDLAQMMLDGEGGSADPRGALPWLESAAKADHPMAQFRLGEIYEEGRIVPQDLAKAESLYAAAAGRGMDAAAQRLSALESAKARADQAPNP